MSLLEDIRGDGRSSRSPGAGRSPGRGAASDRLVQLAELGLGDRHERRDPASPASSSSWLGEGLGLAQATSDLPDLAELVERRPELEADSKACSRATVLWQMSQRGERALEAGHRVSLGEPFERSGPGPAEMEDGLVPDLALEVMQTECEVVRTEFPAWSVARASATRR